MADLKQAEKWMREGKRVYSRDSQRAQDVYMNLESELCYSFPSMVRTQFGIADLLADDWEIAE